MKKTVINRRAPQWAWVLLTLCILAEVELRAETRMLDAKMHHLRSGPREWSSFPAEPEGPRLEVRFPGTKNSAEIALGLRQQDVKQNWDVSLNGKSLGKLLIDENDLTLYFPVPANTLVDGENSLRIEQPGAGRPSADDIRVGQFELFDRAVKEVLNESEVVAEVFDADNGMATPCRLTLLDSDGAMQTVGTSSNEHMAIRPGMIYSSNGQATFGVPAGTYKLYAGRGFEYSLDQQSVTLKAGETVKKTLRIRREVSTPGYAACDTHVHTLTHSGHGDASVLERMITLAGEGIELPVATDHNVQIDHDPFARQAKVRQYFTPVVGNEVTTKVGHFNVFPIPANAPPPNAKLEEWGAIFDEIGKLPGDKAVILNHARDLHGGTRPFGPKLHNPVVGENLDGWPMRFNAMEVVNSGATQTDQMRLFHDWMGLLNRGRFVTPVGSSDSHDVGRHFVGQGRTYIRCDDRDPGNINVDDAVRNFRSGHVRVSYGLLVELVVNDNYTSGETAVLGPNHDATVSVRVLAPHWISADRVLWFENGQLRRTEMVAESAADLPKGVKWTKQFQLARPKHDVHLVAIALGPGIPETYWKTAKPYQPTSPDWESHVIGCSGAVWLDVDGDGRGTSAFDYAQRLFKESAGDRAKLIKLLSDYDEAVAAQAAHLCVMAGDSPTDASFQALLSSAAPMTKEGFRAYTNAWRENQIARGSP